MIGHIFNSCTENLLCNMYVYFNIIKINYKNIHLALLL